MQRVEGESLHHECSSRLSGVREGGRGVSIDRPRFTLSETVSGHLFCNLESDLWVAMAEIILLRLVRLLTNPDSRLVVRIWHFRE